MPGARCSESDGTPRCCGSSGRKPCFDPNNRVLDAGELFLEADDALFEDLRV
jgi:hypothetical protein